MALYDWQLQALHTIIETALKSEAKTGVPAEITAAQCCIESGYLEHAPGHNAFGIKASSRHPYTQLLRTHEVLNDTQIDAFLKRGSGRQLLSKALRPDGKYDCVVMDLFAAFLTLEDCFADHDSMLKSVPAYAIPWHNFNIDHDVDALIIGVASRYATDPHYGAKLLNMKNSVEFQAALASAMETAK